MSKNMAEPKMAQKIWRRHVAYWISKPTRLQAHIWTDERTHARKLMHALTHARVNREREREREKWVMLIAFHAKSAFLNAPQCYVTRSLAVLQLLMLF
jgi:hypothetical protein